MSTTAPQHPATRARIPALDGLRGLALLGMLAWHAHVGWVKGGFARMTIFFVLSGYLATRSYLSLRRRSEPRPFRAFWIRRARRLLPVTVLALVLGVAVTLAAGSAAARSSLPGDVASVALYGSNWRFLLNGQSYGALFERPSAFQHFWSLSLEEQLFVVLPLVLAVAVVLGRRRWAWVVTGSVAFVLAALPAIVAHSPDAAYYGTHVRGGEFLAGVTLALVLDRWGGRVPERAEPAVRIVGALGLAGLVLVMLTIDRTEGWLYAGGLGLFALPAVAAVAAALTGAGPTVRVLALTPLVALGRWAFSIYALHWPLLLWLTPERLGLPFELAVVVQLGLSVALGAVVFHLVERPLLAPPGAAEGAIARRLRWNHPTRPVALLGGAIAVVVVATLLVPPPRPDAVDTIQEQLAAAQSPLDGDLVPVRATEGRIGVAMFGGSTAVALGAGAVRWNARAAVAQVVPGYSRLGCGLLTRGRRVYGREADGRLGEEPPGPECTSWPDQWSAALSRNQPRVALLITGVWETTDWLLDGDDTWRRIGDPVVDERIRTRLDEAIDLLEAGGTRVALVTTPRIGDGLRGDVHELRSLGLDHAERVAAYNELLRQTAERRALALIDYGSYVDAWDPARSASWLPDGIHATEDAAEAIWDEFLGPTVEDLIRLDALARTIEAGDTPPATLPGGPAVEPAPPRADQVTMAG